ncbi:MAG: hypothetical protein GWN67_04505 [Phycisphaerae bacterium]|nr:hypothetical protein [Phycisphaerae bacterium]NIP51184.1 hypothetical protein [Phycisphaerae bacterium]NIS50395.1 hypothetical protein [Phycisphaerae bacterium]NIU08125.1 hypothetical protein [Phycisphaerae bacterium]NIU55668.1 hypothetical protein [Phycisphaerae bacterium]
MALIGSGIGNVRAFELPCGIWADGESVGSPRTVLVKWRSVWEDKFYQVYVNGQYGGATIDSQQRQMIVQMPTSLESPVRIEVFAVEAEQAGIDFSSEIGSPVGPSGRVRISMLRGQRLPVGAIAQVYFDNGTGEIDYDKVLNESPIRIWPARQDKAGFGMNCFAVGDFGYDSAAAVGFGRGVFGQGQFGLDADSLEWTSPVIGTGVYRFAVKVTDGLGNESDSIETDQVMLTSAARPAEKMNIFSFDKQTNQLVLGVS